MQAQTGQIHKCKFCGQEFINAFRLTKHRQSEHRDLMRQRTSTTASNNGSEDALTRYYKHMDASKTLEQDLEAERNRLQVRIKDIDNVLARFKHLTTHDYDIIK